MPDGFIGTPMAWRRACPWLPALVKAGRVLIGPSGEVVRVDAFGELGFVVTAGQPWHRSISADPCAERRR